MCSQTECFSQTLAISMIGSNAPKTVVPAVAITTSGHIPCEGRREKRKRRRRKEGGGGGGGRREGGGEMREKGGRRGR